MSKKNINYFAELNKIETTVALRTILSSWNLEDKLKQAVFDSFNVSNVYKKQEQIVAFYSHLLIHYGAVSDQFLTDAIPEFNLFVAENIIEPYIVNLSQGVDQLPGISTKETVEALASTILTRSALDQAQKDNNQQAGRNLIQTLPSLQIIIQTFQDALNQLLKYYAGENTQYTAQIYKLQNPYRSEIKAVLDQDIDSVKERALQEYETELSQYVSQAV